ncbi:MAG: S9 family peptidase [Alistipes sp.]|nr:S9 family peptidase [Alistipes sp.]
MKKHFIAMASLLLGAVGCNSAPEPLTVNSTLTAEEIAEARLTPEVMWKMGRIGSAEVAPDGSKVLYTVTRYSMEENRGVTQIYTLSLADGTVAELTDTSSNNTAARWNTDGSRIYLLSNRSGSMQLWSMAPDGSDPKQITDVEGGIEDYGVSPDGKHLHYVKAVHVKDIRSADVHKDMPHSKARIYDDLMARHWDYWDEGEYRHIFVAPIVDGKATEARDITGAEAAWDTPLAPYFDGGEIAWHPHGKQLAYTCKPLTGKEYAVSTDSDIFVHLLESDHTLNICKSTDLQSITINGKPADTKHFVGYDKYPVWSPDGSKIAFRSQERAGNESDKQRLFVYDVQSGKAEYITASFDYHAENIVWADEQTLYFIAPIEATHQICRAKLDGSPVEVITAGDHDITSFSLGGGRCVATVQKISMATELFEVELSDGEMRQISHVNKEVYENIRLGEVQKRWVRTTDGKRMLVWVILPPDFDPARKYPTLLYCQGGPQNVVSQFWSYRWNFQLMAAQGYVVVAPNRRGLPSFGQEWLDQISGDYSGQNIRDYLSAIDDVAKEPWCDRERLGCVGASYGGYSVFYLAGHHQKRFKAFIAHCGIFNFESMYGETEELFFLNNDYGGAYWEKNNRTAKRSYAHSPHKFVTNWDTPILIFTGEYDFRIPYTQSLQAFTAARMLGIPARLVEFENEAHQVLRPQNSLVWNREFFGWLDKYLK